MKKTRYSQKPAPVLIQRHKDYVHITIALNATESAPGDAQQPGEEEGTHTAPQWEADTNEFWEKQAEIDTADVQAHPEAYLHYVTAHTRRQARQQAQHLLDTLRDGCPIVPVPSYREGAAVCNRAADQVKLVAGLQMGGLPYYELASGEVVHLSAEDIRAIAADVAAAETAWQQAKQACWRAIDAAESESGINAALAEFAASLNAYTS